MSVRKKACVTMQSHQARGFGFKTYIGLAILFYILVNFYPQMSGILIAIGTCILGREIYCLADARHQRSVKKQMLIDFQWNPKMSPLDFEANCARYLGMRGWKAKTTKGSGDQGVDVFAQKEGVKIVLQCKLYSKPVGNKAVQEALAGKTYSGAHQAAVVSNQRYTKSAHELAIKANVKLLHFTDLVNADIIFLT
jgi:restriction system protein